MQIAVIGAGGWGTALAILLTSGGHQVRLWVRKLALCEQMQKERENTPYLPGVILPEQLTPTSSLQYAATEAQLIVLAIPSHALRTIANELSLVVHGLPIIVSATKGIEEESLLTMSTVLSVTLGKNHAEHIAVLSGPSFAAEVARQLPTAVTVAARMESLAATVQKTFSTPRFRVYTTTDVLGVELGGAVKNVIALAAGVSDGLGYGHSARAAVITRGLAEIKRLAVRMGAESQTLSGLSGMGDLILTCTSDLSRNYRVGVRLAQGEPITSILQSMVMVAEGVRTSRSVFALAHRLSVDMPIATQVYKLLYEEKPPRQVVTDLLAREVKPEFSQRKN